jgi:hypothetical protein
MYPEYLKLLFSRDSFLTCLKKVTQGITPEQSEYVTIAQVSHPEPKSLEIKELTQLVPLRQESNTEKYRIAQ